MAHFAFRNKYLIIVISQLVAICSSSFAQTNNVIGLKQAIDSAIKNYPELTAKQLEIKSANAAVRDAKDQRLPSLKLGDQVDLGYS